MARVFISFLGLGNYNPVRYDNGVLSETEYVQSAILEKNGKDFFDRIRILVTDGSKEKHWGRLKNKIDTYITQHASCEMILISDDLVNGQWKWFETVLSLVENGDTVWFDMTHGYRAFSIVLSAALSFIQKTKNIQLMAVYYGAHEAPGAPIIDMKGFYQINEWADGVAQLIDSADTSRLAALSELTDIDTFSSLRDKNLVTALNDLAQIIKNVDVNHITDKADKALAILQEKMNVCSGADCQLLQMVTEKFATLSTSCPASGKYDNKYFTVQLAFITMLNKHSLYMQSFTVMRECIGSIGMLGAKTKHNKNMDNDDGRKGRHYADVFVNMIQYEVAGWIFENDNEQRMQQLRPFYESLLTLGVIGQLREFIKNLIDLRNGFDHAWTAAGPDKRKLLDNVQIHAEIAKDKLTEIIRILKEHGEIYD